MPQHDDTPDYTVCDGCGRNVDPDGAGQFTLEDLDHRGHYYCSECAARRRNDPMVVIHGRSMTVSELERQAEDDESLAAALDGDTLHEQIAAAHADAKARAQKG